MLLENFLLKIHSGTKFSEENLYFLTEIHVGTKFSIENSCFHKIFNLCKIFVSLIDYLCWHKIFFTKNECRDKTFNRKSHVGTNFFHRKFMLKYKFLWNIHVSRKFPVDYL